jgi:hypothetical protein
LIVDIFSIFADFSGSAGNKVGGIHFISHTGTFLPAHEKNAGDLEIGHESIKYVIHVYVYDKVTYSGCTKYSAPANHYVIMPKKPKFREFLFGKIKKEEFARRFFKKPVYFCL